MAEFRGRILIVDDEPLVVDLTSRYLREHGFETCSAFDGRQAIDGVERQPVDLILLDVEMPVVSGLEVCRLLKSRIATQNIPIIIVTGRNSPEDVVYGLEAGADDYLCKPVRLAELKARIDRLVRRKQRLDDLDAENQELIDALGCQSQTVVELFSLSMQMNRAAELDDLWAVIARHLMNGVGCRRISIDLWDARAGRLRRAFAAGRPAELDVELPVAAESMDALFASNRPALLRREDAVRWQSEYARWLPWSSGATAALPMQVNGRRIGVIHLSEWDLTPPSESKLAALHYFNQAAAVAVANRLGEQQVRETQDVTIFAMAKLAENRDELTGNHLLRVQTYSREIARRLRRHPRWRQRTTDEFIQEIWRAAPLHDIGKVGIPDHILLKPGRLTPDEFEIMTRHTLIGGKTIEEACTRLRHESFLKTAQEVCYSHHERWDGQGYPHRLAGEAIPPAARIVACADVYDALTTARPYKPAFPHERAKAIIADGRGAHFDPDVCDAFLELSVEFDRIREKLQEEATPGHALVHAAAALQSPADGTAPAKSE